MDKKYLEMAFLWGAHNYIDLKIVIKLEKKYASYKDKDGWDNISTAVCEYFEGLDEDGIIEFIKEYIIMLQNSKFQNNSSYEGAFIMVILGFVYGGFIHGNNEKYHNYSQLKKYLLSILQNFADSMSKTYSNYEKISFYKQEILKQFDGK